MDTLLAISAEVREGTKSIEKWKVKVERREYIGTKVEMGGE